MSSNVQVLTKSFTAVAEYHSTATAFTKALNNSYLELKKIDKALKHERRTFRREMLVLRQKHAILQSRRQTLLEWVRALTPSAELNKANQRSAERRFQEDQQARQRLFSRITNMQCAILDALVRRDRKKEIIKHYECLLKVVDAAINKGDGLNSVSEMFSHHKCLLSVKDELDKKREEAQRAYLLTRSKLFEYKHAQALQQRYFAQKILTQICLLNKKESETLELERVWSEVKNATSSLCLTLGYIRLSIRNIYAKICQLRRRSPELQDVHAQLRIIARFFGGNWDYLENEEKKSKRKKHQTLSGSEAALSRHDSRREGRNMDDGTRQSARLSVTISLPEPRGSWRRP